MCAAGSDASRTSPWLSVVVVNWNGRPLLADCLGSLRDAGVGVRTLLVDNGSADDSIAWTRERHPEVEILASPENLRWAGGNNLGLRALLDAGGEEPVLLLNNDTVVPPGSLERLVAALDETPEAWAATPRICYAEAPDAIWYDGGRVGRWTGWVAHDGIRKPAAPRPSARRFTDYGTGCALLLSRHALAAVGLLDEAYWLYAEDSDYSLRLRAEGGRIVHEPASLILHKVSRSLGAESPRKAYLKSRSHVRLLRTHWRRRTWPVLWPAQAAWTAAQAARHLVQGRPAAARAAVTGMLDGLSGRGTEDGSHVVASG